MRRAADPYLKQTSRSQRSLPKFHLNPNTRRLARTGFLVAVLLPLCS
jgi:hypothetical protein